METKWSWESRLLGRYIQNLHVWPQLRGHLGVGAQLAAVKSQPRAPDGPDTSLLVYNAVWALC